MKKIYQRPALVVHGGAARLTKNRHFGDLNDFIGFRWIPT
jgi:hypothetical protein